MSVHTHANTPLASRNTCLAPCQAHSDCSINVSCISKNSVCVCIYIFIYLFIYLSKSWLFNTFNKKYMSQIRPLHGSLCLFWELEQHKHDVWSGNRSLTSNMPGTVEKLLLLCPICTSKQSNPIFLFQMRKHNQV